MSDPDMILEFCQTCGADPILAQKYLMIANNDLHHAISLFLDLGGVDLPDDDTASTLPPTTTTDGPLLNHSPIQSSIHNNNSLVLHDDLDLDVDFDEEIRLHNEINNTILQHQSQLPPARPLFSHSPNHHPSAQRSGYNPFSQHPGREYSPIGSTDSSAQLTDRQSRLMEMYRPPRELMYHGTFENAKETGRMEKKWLIIDVNDDTHFACQVLNRDIWKNKALVEVIKELFIFLQIARHSDMGMQFTAMYPVTRYPHVCLVDPRTGERVKELSRTQTESAGALVEALYEFLDRHSLVSTTFPLRPAEAPSAASREVVVLDDDESDSDVDASSRIARCGPLTDPEPSVPGTCRIQIRFPDGSRLVRRFLGTAPVLDLYRAVKFARPDTAGGDKGTNEPLAFELVFVRQNLMECLDCTIEETGLANASITMNYV